MTENDSIGSRIRTARTAAGLTQQELADIVARGIRQRVNDWEAGRRTPNRENVAAIAEVLGVTPGRLMFGE